MKPKTGHFYVRKGEQFDAHDITGKRIAIFQGWPYDERCLARQKDIVGNIVPIENIRQFIFEDVKGAAEALKNHEVDAILASKTWNPFVEFMEESKASGFTIEERGEIQCILSGNSMGGVTRKGPLCPETVSYQKLPFILFMA